MCLSPITIKVNNINGLRSMQVPCGKCPECLKSKQNEWLVRLYHEFLDKPKAVFFTLTYKESTVPHGESADPETGEFYRSVCKDDVQRCFKRFRRFLDKHYTDCDRPKFSYYITSEYGPRTLRPHYHGLIFGISREQFWPFLVDWSSRYGFVNCSDIEVSESHHQKTARYVSKYCTKGMFENPLVKLGFVKPTFHLISKGLGLSYVLRSKDYHLAKDSVFYKPTVHYSDDYLDEVLSRLNCIMPNGSTSSGITAPKQFKYKLPKYYKDHIFVDSSGNKLYFLSAALARRSREVADDLYFQQLEKLQAEWNCSLCEACSIYHLQDSAATRLRNEEAYKALGNFFDHSTI